MLRVANLIALVAIIRISLARQAVIVEERMILSNFASAAIFVIVFGLVGFRFWEQSRKLKRAQFVREYRWPPGLLDRLTKHHPEFARKETALVGQGLRQFFLAYLLSGNKYVAMPSQVADDLWHEFIIYTKEYRAFCQNAFGTFLHHSPAAVLKPEQQRSNEGLRRVWWYSCLEENISPKNPTRLPLLFALDTKFDIKDGYKYTPDCSSLRKNGVLGTECGGDMSSSSIDGGTSGFGGDGHSGHGGDGHGGDGGGHGCGGDGGCGGGCGGD